MWVVRGSVEVESRSSDDVGRPSTNILKISECATIYDTHHQRQRTPPGLNVFHYRAIFIHPRVLQLKRAEAPKCPSPSHRQPFSKTSHIARMMMKSEQKSQRNRVVASTGSSARPVTRWETTCTSAEADSRSVKISITKNCHHFDDISAVKLKRTDTTLDLSQKAKRAGEERKKKRKKWGEDGFI